MRLPDLDSARLQDALRLAERIYRLHEAGLPYTDELHRLSEATGQAVTRLDADGAFGSIGWEDWAHDLLAQSEGVPSDLSRADLVEMVQCIQSAVQPEWQLGWVIRCIEHVTKCADVIGLLDSPRDLSPEQLVDAAFASPRRVLVTPPPEDSC